MAFVRSQIILFFYIISSVFNLLEAKTLLVIWNDM